MKLITWGVIEKALIGFFSVLFAGALLYYLREFKQNQDAMTSIMVAEHGQGWAKPLQNEHVSVRDLWQKAEQLATEQKQLKGEIRASQTKIDSIVRWTEQLRTRMSAWGTNDRYGKANLNTNQQPVVYLNTRHSNGQWFEIDDTIVITNRHRGAQGPEYIGKVASAYPFLTATGQPDSESLVQISPPVATRLKLSLKDGVFDISVRKERAIPFVPSVEEVGAR